MVRWMKRAGVELLIGAVMGFVLWCITGKSLTSMFYGTPGGTFSCQADVEKALTHFLALQLYSALGGALVVAIATELIRRAWSRRKQRSVPPIPAAPSGLS
jgi:hypothetical protein